MTDEKRPDLEKRDGVESQRSHAAGESDHEQPKLQWDKTQEIEKLKQEVMIISI